MARMIDRRAVLRGAGGVALALPALEIMAGRKALAAGVPRRFVLGYAGVSIGGNTAPFDLVVPRTVGRNFETTPGLKALDALMVKGDVGIVSGLKIPWGTTST